MVKRPVRKPWINCLFCADRRDPTFKRLLLGLLMFILAIMFVPSTLPKVLSIAELVVRGLFAKGGLQ